jgi:hypothetical protein
VSEGETCSRSSVSAERLISQAKAGEPAQKMKKMKATAEPVESAITGMASPTAPTTTAPYIMP